MILSYSSIQKLPNVAVYSFEMSDYILAAHLENRRGILFFDIVQKVFYITATEDFLITYRTHNFTKIARNFNSMFRLYFLEIDNTVSDAKLEKLCDTYVNRFMPSWNIQEVI